MTNEPVAYLVSQEPYSSVRYIVCDKPVPIGNEKITPLYTKEQLQPRVEMTKKQHNKFENYKVDSNSFYHFWQSLLVDDVSLFKEISERDLMLAWLDDRAIEIVPEKKWFVQRNDTKDRYRFLSKDIVTSDNEFNYSSLKYSAKQFDTKEEAEEWTNPLTEAVLLPVEGE